MPTATAEKTTRDRKRDFYNLPRLGRIPPGELWTLDEIAATLGYRDYRICLEKLRERGVPMDDWGSGHVLVPTDLFIEVELEICRARMQPKK